MDLVTLPIRVMKVLGIQYLFVSNAAGGVNFDYKVGDMMVISDHISHLPNPLIGPNMAEFGPRFPDMTRPYDPKLRKMAFEIAAGLGYSLKSGVYFASTGPTYETPAEYKYYRIIGSDAVGMSTIPEVIVARHSDIPVFGMSVITNEAHDDYAEDYVNDGDDVVKAADAAADRMTAIFTTLIERL
jgi:purine-nucleoside phosphorylase